MMREDDHPSDATLLLDADGELAPPEEKRVRAHLETCWKCRARRAKLERAIEEFVPVHQERFDGLIPPAEGPRALLRARMAAVAAAPAPLRRRLLRDLEWVAAICVLFLLGLTIAGLTAAHKRASRESAVVFVPDARLTPGATVLADRAAVCAGPGAKNKPVPVALRRQVFAEYGIAGNDPSAYEVDYLVTPALGGADDIHNLWPHSYNAAWNARVKDELEDRLRDLVCAGGLDLASAQRDIATDWIGAYKKYFHTDKPLD